MGIDMASVYAAKYRKNPDVLRAAVMGQSPDASLDSYTALNALKLVKEADMMAMAGQAQQPTSSPSLVAQNMAPAMPQGLGAMVPGTMGGQGMPQGQAPMPQQPMRAASGGLAGMYTPEEDYAAGGIIAFQDRGLVPAVSDDATRRISRDDGETDSGAEIGFPMFTSKGDPETYAALAQQLPGAIQSMSDFEYEGLTPKGRKKVEMDEIAAFREAMGPNTAMDTLRADVNARKGERAGNLEEGKGVALLKAAAAMAQGNNWVRAFGNAGAAFGDEYNRALQADKLEKRSIAVAEFNMADAQRKENMGLFREGRAAGDRAVVAQQTAEKARFEKTKAVADALTKGMTATKPLNSSFRTGAGGTNIKDFVVGPETYLAQIKEEHPEYSPAKQKAEAFKLFQQGKSAGLQGAVIKADTAADQLTAKRNESVAKSMAVWKDSGEARKAKTDGTITTAKAAAEAEFRRQAMAGVFDDGNETSSAAPAAAPAANPRTVLKFDQSGKQIK